MEKVIPWGVGGGNLHLAYTGRDNGEIVITSDTENYTGTERYEVLTVATGKSGLRYVSLVARLTLTEIYWCLPLRRMSRYREVIW